MIVLRIFFQVFSIRLLTRPTLQLFIYIIHIDRYNIIWLKPLASVVSFTYTAIQRLHNNSCLMCFTIFIAEHVNINLIIYIVSTCIISFEK